jgi:hypothetical protein
VDVNLLPSPPPIAATAPAIKTHFVDLSTGKVTIFKTREDTIFAKILKKFSDSQGYQLPALRFASEGNRITPFQQPCILKMKDGDEIEVTVEMDGERN